MSSENSIPLKALIATLVVGAGIWVFCVTLSSHLSGKAPANSAVRSPGSSAPSEAKAVGSLSPEIEQMEKELASDPGNIPLRLVYADRLTRAGAERGDAQVLMRAVESYLQVLELDQKNGSALLGLANVSFESGVFDRAAGYYRRYLLEKPDDLKANTDLALTLIQIKEDAEAIQILKRVISLAPKLFPARMGLALAYRVAGDTEGAIREAEEARVLAPDNEGKEMLERFLTELRSGESAVKQGAELESSAGILSRFFRNHQILGPKVVSIDFPDSGQAVVTLSDFPVSAMPEFARKKFEGNVREMLRSLSGPVTLRLVDVKTKERLMEFLPEER